MVDQYSVLVIGSGGREHAICWKLSQSEFVHHIYVAPGNCGIAQEKKVEIVNINIKNNKEIGIWCKKENVNIVIVGPEDYLASGLANELQKIDIKCFGPQQDAAQIETNKDWAKQFMDRHNIPTARWKGFTNPNEAKEFVQKAPFQALVIKASGLAAGKGVVVAKNNEEAFQAIDEILVLKKFGFAGDSIVVEELLEGEEVSMLAFTDGKTIVSMKPAQDHKRIFDGDQGLNTGGMGAYCPCPLLSESVSELVKVQILQKAINGLMKENISYVGVLYAGLMLTADGPKVLEFNCRFGDPETQVILPLLKSDLFIIIKACCEGNLQPEQVVWRENIFSTGVILASRGYPQSSSKGQIIKEVEKITTRRNHFIFHSGTRISSDGDLETNGGRVLITVALASSLILATSKATAAAKDIQFDGKQFRTDIAHKGIARSLLNNSQMTYKSSGVDIQAGDSLVSTIKSVVSSTKRSGSLGDIGGFGGLFDPKAAGFEDPLLVSGTDGVGTKLKIAIEYRKHDTVGIDLVAMCVNDILAHGAEPLFFLDYFACGKLDVDIATKVINGIVEGCKQAGCTLIGGETAEMPDMYQNEEYDLAGFAVGAVERINLLPRKNEIKPHDILIGLPSSGLHSNGFSLVRKVFKLTDKRYSDIAPFSIRKRTFGEELLIPTKIYVDSVTTAFKSNLVKAFAHITGGGLIENIPRVLPDSFGVRLDARKWKIQSIFSWLAATGGIGKYEMLKTFNCGIGGVLICSSEYKNQVLTLLEKENAVVIGEVLSMQDSERVNVLHFEEVMEREIRKYIQPLIKQLSVPLKKVGVLISGSGTNLQALIDATQNYSLNIGAEIVLVISNKSGVEGINRAERAGIPTKVIKHTNFASRNDFDKEMDKELVKAEVEIVCLAGFMRILSAEFVQKWRGALINIHPSLLPAFKGANAHKDVLKYGARITGCTVHFVAADVDSGAIIEQESVPVFPQDTVETLQERVKNAEHRIFPKALKYLTTGRIRLKDDDSLEWIY